MDHEKVYPSTIYLDNININKVNETTYNVLYNSNKLLLFSEIAIKL